MQRKRQQRSMARYNDCYTKMLNQIVTILMIHRAFQYSFYVRGPTHVQVLSIMAVQISKSWRTPPRQRSKLFV